MLTALAVTPSEPPFLPPPESDTWGDPKHYDYIVHTNTLGLDGTAEMISEIVRIREKVVGSDSIIK